MSKKTVLNRDSTSESYDAQAIKYDERWEGYIHNTHQKLLNKLQANSGDRIIDLSAGTGVLAKLVKQKNYEFDEFVLNDISPKMLGVAKKKIGSADRFKFTEYPAHKLDFEANSFDRVISMNAFHNYPDQAAVIREVYRVLKPGGVFYLLDWNRQGLFRMINFWIEKFSSEIIQCVSVDEANSLLESYNFDTQHKETWSFSYWNLFLISAIKQPA